MVGVLANFVVAVIRGPHDPVQSRLRLRWSLLTAAPKAFKTKSVRLCRGAVDAGQWSGHDPPIRIGEGSLRVAGDECEGYTA